MRHNESKMQSACVRYFRYAYPQYSHMLFSVPNGVATTETQGRILKAEGMLAGVSDLLFLVARKGFHGLCIEMKDRKGIQRETQKEWQAKVEQQGYKYIIVRSFDQFQQEMQEYLDENDGMDDLSARSQLSKLLK